MIKLVKVSKRYNKRLFSNFSYTFNIGKIYSFIGPSGCGKSTLLSMIANKCKKYNGNIYYHDVDIKSLRNYTFDSVGYMYQDYQLFDELSGIENIILYFKLKGIDYTPYICRINVLSKHFKVFNILNQKVKYMSGGEKQRIAIIKTIIKNPSVILLDEPSSALDKDNSNLLIEYLHLIKKDKIIIVVTHDISLANKCDELIDFTSLKSMDVKVKKSYKKERKIKFNNLSKLYNKVLASKKIYSYISTAILSFGLISISLSFVIKDFVNEIVSSSFSIFNTNEYVTFKAKETKTSVDFKSLECDDINFVYYEGIASDQKILIKENSMIDKVCFNDLILSETSFVFDNYLSSHQQNFVLYIPKNAIAYSKSINHLYVYYGNRQIKILIDEVYQSTDNNYYIYCNNISYLYKYFKEYNIAYDLYRYYYSYDSLNLYNMLINKYEYKDYLFYHFYEDNVIQIVENNYSRLTKDIIDVDYLYCDFIHTYIDYDSGLIYLLDEHNTIIIIDDNLKANQIGVLKKFNIKDKYLSIFGKEYEVVYESNELNYKIIYMSKFAFNMLNDDNAYVGIISIKDKNLIDLDYFIINENLFDNKSINSFEYISKFLLFFSILIIILAFLSTITIFNINFISKKKDIVLLSNLGIYDETLIKLMLKEPILNILYCGFYGAFFMVLSCFLVSIIYQSLTNITLSVNVSISLLLSILLLPLCMMSPILLVKCKMFLLNNIKK